MPPPGRVLLSPESNTLQARSGPTRANLRKSNTLPSGDDFGHLRASGERGGEGVFKLELFRNRGRGLPFVSWRQLTLSGALCGRCARCAEAAAALEGWEAASYSARMTRGEGVPCSGSSCDDERHDAPRHRYPPISEGGSGPAAGRAPRISLEGSGPRIQDYFFSSSP